MRRTLATLYVILTLLLYGIRADVVRKVKKKRRLITDGINSTDPEVIHVNKQSLNKKAKNNAISSRKKSPPSRDTIDIVRARWPLKVPYTTVELTSEEGNKIVRDSIRDIENKTCLTFVRKTAEVDYINFRDGEGCFSQIGKRGGAQDVILGEGCFTQPKIEHEIMHTLGSYHEQNRPDRDKYVEIIFKNIIPKFKEQFIKRSKPPPEGKYDYGSIMHYGKWAFTRNKKPIMMTKPVNGKRFRGDYGVHERHGGMTKWDAKTLNSYYSCDRVAATSLVDPEVYPDTRPRGKQKATSKSEN